MARAVHGLLDFQKRHNYSIVEVCKRYYTLITLFRQKKLASRDKLPLIRVTSITMYS